MLLRSLILRVSSRPWFERFIKGSRLTRGVVKRFIAGDTLEEAMAVAESLANQGFYVTLDMLGENTQTDEQADAACAEYAAMLKRIAQSPHAGGQAPERINISIKLTQIGLVRNQEHCEKRLQSLSDIAKDSSNFVRADMEDSSCTEATIEVLTKVFASNRNIGGVLQAMMKRTPQDWKTISGVGMRVRLVKGAYLEKEDVALQGRGDIDAAFRDLSMEMLEHGSYPAFGTHDGQLIDAIIKHAQAKNIEPARFEFQMLYGIRRDLQQKLKDRGFNVRVYVAYGSAWYPYFTRRLAERPANLFFFLRSLFGK